MKIEDLFRILYKVTIGPYKYSKEDGYDAENYWKDRFSKYGFSIKGVGHEGLSEEENVKKYYDIGKVFKTICYDERIDFQISKILEIGIGTGFYTNILHDLGAKNYTGIDITDVLFFENRKKFSQYEFIKKDITVDKIDDKFDLIVMIDVIEHIVEKSKFVFAMNNIKNALSSDGIFIIYPITDITKKHIFYVHSWSLKDMNDIFSGYNFREVMVQNNKMLMIKNNI